MTSCFVFVFILYFTTDVVDMPQASSTPSLPNDLEVLFLWHESDPEDLLMAFMPVFCDHIQADRMFIQARNPDTRICKVLRWRRGENIPWYATQGPATLMHVR